jgi:broad specificity phosphatase PhoE
MLPRSFYFLRHGETEWNKEVRFQGSEDVPLNETGREQARLAALKLKDQPIDRIVASPLLRVYETAEIINEFLKKPIETDIRLREKSFGFYEGKTLGEVKEWEKNNPDKLGVLEPETGFTLAPQGEAYREFQVRVFTAVQEAVQKYPDETILFVAHGGVYSALHYTLFNKIKHSLNAEPFHFLREAPKQWVLVSG